MWASLAPIKTRIRKTPSQLPHLFNVHAETFERFRSGRGQFVSIIQPPEFLESIVQGNSQMPGEMIVTDSRRTQARGRVRNKLPARLVHEYAQTLEHPGN